MPGKGGISRGEKVVLYVRTSRTGQPAWNLLNWWSHGTLNPTLGTRNPTWQLEDNGGRTVTPTATTSAYCTHWPCRPDKPPSSWGSIQYHRKHVSYISVFFLGKPKIRWPKQKRSILVPFWSDIDCIEWLVFGHVWDCSRFAVQFRGLAMNQGPISMWNLYVDDPDNIYIYILISAITPQNITICSKNLTDIQLCISMIIYVYYIYIYIYIYT